MDELYRRFGGFYIVSESYELISTHDWMYLKYDDELKQIITHAMIMGVTTPRKSVTLTDITEE